LCIQNLLKEVIVCTCLLSPFTLQCSVTLLFIFLSVCLFHLFIDESGLLSHTLLLYLNLSVSLCSVVHIIWNCIQQYLHNSQLLWFLDGLLFLLICSVLLLDLGLFFLEIYIVRCGYSYSCLVSVSAFWIYYFPSFTFQSVCIFASDRGIVLYKSN
jgi:hypothetical protein